MAKCAKLSYAGPQWKGRGRLGEKGTSEARNRTRLCPQHHMRRGRGRPACWGGRNVRRAGERLVSGHPEDGCEELGSHLDTLQ